MIYINVYTHCISRENSLSDLLNLIHAFCLRQVYKYKFTVFVHSTQQFVKGEDHFWLLPKTSELTSARLPFGRFRRQRGRLLPYEIQHDRNRLA